jgi:hypothetical protein
LRYRSRQPQPEESEFLSSHGRIETRRLETTSALAEYLNPLWSGVAQVCRITRERIIRGKKTIETVYAITSLTAERASAEQLLALSRAHWRIESVPQEHTERSSP